MPEVTVRKRVGKRSGGWKYKVRRWYYRNRPQVAVTAAFALGAGRPGAFVFLARHADEAGDPTRALELWSAAAATDPRRTDVVKYLTMRLARLRRCDDAERELARALAREPRKAEEARDLAQAADWVKMCRR